MDRPPYRHVVRTKVVPPSFPDGLIMRERILARLSMAQRFTLVSAMPGYGKTALVRQLIDTLEAPVAWLSLDLLDHEPLTFWTHVLYAIGSAVPGIDQEPAMLLRERGVNAPLFLAALIALLGEADRPVVLVLDGLPDPLDRSILAGLALLVERAGETLRVVATTRTDPPLPLARWRARGWLAEVRGDDLRLADDEAVAVAAAADTAFRDSADAVAINHRVGGWPIALHMALLARPSGSPRPEGFDELLAGNDRLLANYLVGEVLEAMSEAERNVALTLSVLEWFDPGLCRELVGSDATLAVRELLGRGMFLTVVDPRTGAMRFHDLFRELMEMELAWRDPLRRVELHRRAAMLWRERGDLMSAYHHLSVIGETGAAYDVLVGPAFELVDRGELDALRRFARQLPTQSLVTNPRLALDLAVVAFYADGTLAARRWCDRADELLAEQAVREGDDLALRLHGLRCAVALLDADLDTALNGIAVHRRLGEATASTNAFERRFPILAARVMLAARRIDEAGEWIAAAERIDGPEIVTAVTVPTLRAWYEWMFGRLDVACDLTGGALQWMAEHRVGAHHLGFDTLITGGWCKLSAGHVAEAARLAEQASVDADKLGNAWNQLQAGYLAARVALVCGDPQRTMQIVDDVRAGVGFDACRVYADRLLAVEVEALAASGRAADAERLLVALEPGPRTQILRARLQRVSDREVDALLGECAGWPVLERLQAELLLNARHHRAAPCDELVQLVADCGRSGWLLPFLGFGRRVERQLQAISLGDLHPQLARTLAYLAPVEAVRRDQPVGVRLTSRELTLVELLPTHLSYAEIGDRLFLSVNTVKSNLKALYRKLDATTRAEAVEASRRAGLL